MGTSTTTTDRSQASDRKRQTTGEAPAPGSPEIARVYAHPIRMQSLRILNERVASPVEIARELDLPVNSVAYHIRVLADAGCVEQVSQRQRRGATEHFYRATTIPMFTDDQFVELPVSIRRRVFGQVISDLFDHVAAASEQDGFDDPETHASWTPMHLDDKGWDDVTKLLANVVDKLPAIEARAAARIAKAGTPSSAVHQTEVGVLHFHRAAKKARRRGR
jgi:DNA-binding transcriptional ArsR family regulator